jgi:single-strand DNA-binding protein
LRGTEQRYSNRKRAMASTNVVVLCGNLTRDPELKSVGDTSVCELGVAVNERRKKGEEWVEQAHFFDVSVWGKQGESCAEYLSKGRQVVVSGRLDYRFWEADDGSKRSKVSVVAHSVQFVGSRDSADAPPAPAPPTADAPPDSPAIF